MIQKTTYADGILEAYEYLLTNHKEFLLLVKDCGALGMLDLQ